ncbi:hypothetical protein HHI36_003330 [Cryptolaemus montrouzieri]|uniref:Uncharacterized protein n=1 Tax=Cryptolaemus montrouzieri TaxID=559131 RepID=A0ABD2PD36_9CUCU
MAFLFIFPFQSIKIGNTKLLPRRKHNCIQKCVEGSLNDVLGCSTRFLMKRTEFDNVDESKGVITFGVETVTNDRFCRVNIKNSEAFIVCYKPDESGDSSTIFAILGFVSAVFLFLTVAIYLALPKLLDLEGICIIHCLLGLACGFIIMGLNRLSRNKSSNFMCQLEAYSLYFSLLYAFFWLNSYCFHLWRSTMPRNPPLQSCGFWMTTSWGPLTQPD